MAMRRAKLQVKPNLGPRFGSKSQQPPDNATKAKPVPAPGVKTVQLPVSQQTFLENFTLLKETTSKIYHPPKALDLSKPEAAVFSDVPKISCSKNVENVPDSIDEISCRIPLSSDNVDTQNCEVGSGDETVSQCQQEMKSPDNITNINEHSQLPRKPSLFAETSPHKGADFHVETSLKSVTISSIPKSKSLGGDKPYIARGHAPKFRPNLIVQKKHVAR